MPRLTLSLRGKHNSASNRAVCRRILWRSASKSKTGAINARARTVLLAAKSAKESRPAHTRFLLSFDLLIVMSARVVVLCSTVADLSGVSDGKDLQLRLLPEDAELFTQTRIITGIKVWVLKCCNKDCGATFYPHPVQDGENVVELTDFAVVQASSSIRASDCTHCRSCGIFEHKWCTVCHRRPRSRRGQVNRSSH